MVEILQCNFERPMAIKMIKEKKSATKKSNFDAAEKVSKATSKKKVVDEEDAEASDVDEDLEEDEVDDDWGKEEEDDDSWDPDFEEFDMPKKATKKAGKGKKGADEDDDFGLDEDLNLEDDLFDDKDEFDDDF
jgi:hypothetical protein